jgi:hypothetical protein
MDLDNRKFARFKAKPGLQASLKANDSELKTDGLVLNVSQGGVYILAPSIPFETGTVQFKLANSVILKQCRRIDPHQAKAQGIALEFTDILAAEELEYLMDTESPF